MVCRYSFMWLGMYGCVVAYILCFYAVGCLLLGLGLCIGVYFAGLGFWLDGVVGFRAMLLVWGF